MLEPLWEGVDRVVLAGDVWQQWKRGPGRARAEQLARDLREQIESRGIVLVSLWGNHDPEGGQGVARLAEGAVLVTHGDAVYDSATPWSRQLSRYRREVEEIIGRYRSRVSSAEACAERAREIARTIRAVPLPKLPPPFNFFATAFWPPARLFGILQVWHGMGGAGLDFLERSGGGARVLVCGHFHRAGIWEGGGKLMLNTGSFMRGSQVWAVDLKDGKITARALNLRDERFHPGEVKGRWFLHP